ncbi:nucleoside triphosphate pyrophosphatase [Anaerofustis sp.]|uniref:Maf family protein n=1 Tax=Anaerofustis sp. TaxID=1872517 RepID=UPI0025B965E1|nr:Maf family protein [Anaerofustis sp.]
MKSIILASKSPRRKDILNMLDVKFEIEVSDVDENFDDKLSVYENLKNIASKKAEAVFCGNEDKIIISADTIVYLDNEVLLKPKNKEDARRILSKLSGRTHSVISGMCVMSNDKVVKECVETYVTFKKLTKEEIEDYISSDEPYDKAGGYAIQGVAGKFISGIKGDYFNVVGLSISVLYDILKDFR